MNIIKLSVAENEKLSEELPSLCDYIDKNITFVIGDNESEIRYKTKNNEEVILVPNYLIPNHNNLYRKIVQILSIVNRVDIIDNILWETNGFLQHHRRLFRPGDANYGEYYQKQLDKFVNKWNLTKFATKWKAYNIMEIHKIPALCKGIYLFLKEFGFSSDARIWYIGQSRCILSRQICFPCSISEGFYNKTFDIIPGGGSVPSRSIILVPLNWNYEEYDLDFVEKFYINMLLPMLNRTFNSKKIFNIFRKFPWSEDDEKNNIRNELLPHIDTIISYNQERICELYEEYKKGIVMELDIDKIIKSVLSILELRREFQKKIKLEVLDREVFGREFRRIRENIKRDRLRNILPIYRARIKIDVDDKIPEPGEISIRKNLPSNEIEPGEDVKKDDEIKEEDDVKEENNEFNFWAEKLKKIKQEAEDIEKRLNSFSIKKAEKSDQAIPPIASENIVNHNKDKNGVSIVKHNELGCIFIKDNGKICGYKKGIKKGTSLCYRHYKILNSKEMKIK